MNVRVAGWSDRDLAAVVDGTRVRVRRNSTEVRWICDEHGEGSEPICSHTQAVWDEPVDYAKYNGRKAHP